MKKTNKYLMLSFFVFLFFVINTNTTYAATTTIDSIQDLYNVRNNLSGNYELGADLDFNDPNSYDTTTSTTGYDTVAEFRTAMTSGTGWLPIGNDSNPFAGNFDGNGYIISNLFINTNIDESVGMFGATDLGSILTNISLENINIQSIDYVYGIGGLVGHSKGVIINSYTTGIIAIYEFGDEVGGLVGEGHDGTITNSYSTVDITGGTWGIGGLVGSNDGADINNCYSSGNIIGRIEENYGSVGGLVGSHAGTITNSYSTGSVSGGYTVGGLVGESYSPITNSYATGNVNGVSRVGGLLGYSANRNTITNSYSTGSVSSTGSDIGGLAGYNDGTITNSYYNSQTSGQSDDTGKGSPRTTLEMTYPYDETSTTTYVGWDFDTIWYHDTTSRANNGYPYNMFVDVISPVITVSPTSTTTATTSVTWVWSTDEDSTYRYIVDQVSTTTVSGAYVTTTSTTQSSGNGTYYLHLEAKDTAGNISTTTVSAVLDNAAPVITVLGQNPVSMYVGDVYTDSGATALDAVDGDRTNNIVVTNSVNTNITGTYTVIYTVSDSLNNTSTATRIVNVDPRIGGGYIPSFTPINNNNNDNNTETEPSNTPSDTTSWTTGKWVKTGDSPVVYFVDTNNIRHAYSNEGIWKSYFNNDFSFVTTVSQEELANYQLDRNVPYNINTLFKISSIPKVYRVGNNRTISWIKTEELAKILYGNNWNKLVHDLPDSLFGDYILEEDTDNDGLNDSDEEIYQTDRNNNDTDGDTYLDGEEVIHKYDPLKAANDKL